MKCILCQSDKEDNIKYGELLYKDDICVHVNCLYLTSNLCQKGKEDEGIYGFLIETIKSEAKNLKKYICCYCKKPSANIGCCHVRCRRFFHMICGLENGALNHFCKTYNSYCDKHFTRSKYRPGKNEQCCICYEVLKPAYNRFDTLNFIRAPCCRNGWFHKLCLQKYAKTAGYFFKCPLCNDAERFREKLLYFGIFIPDQDAAWELETNAYNELLQRPNQCSAEVCKKSLDREHNSDGFIYCNTCGSVALHEECLPEHMMYFNCKECLEVIGGKKLNGTLKHECLTSSNESDIDVESFELDKLELSTSQQNSNNYTECSKNNETLDDVCLNSSNESDIDINNFEMGKEKLESTDKNKPDGNEIIREHTFNIEIRSSSSLSLIGETGNTETIRKTFNIKSEQESDENVSSSYDKEHLHYKRKVLKKSKKQIIKSDMDDSSEDEECNTVCYKKIRKPIKIYNIDTPSASASENNNNNEPNKFRFKFHITDSGKKEKSSHNSDKKYKNRNQLTTIHFSLKDNEISPTTSNEYVKNSSPDKKTYNNFKNKLLYDDDSEDSTKYTNIINETISKHKLYKRKRYDDDCWDIRNVTKRSREEYENKKIRSSRRLRKKVNKFSHLDVSFAKYRNIRIQRLNKSNNNRNNN